MPAVVTAKASTQPRIGTLRITPEPGGGIEAEFIRGSGPTLEAQSTLSSTERGLSPDQRALAALAGNLASKSGFDATGRMRDLGVDFVLLAPPATAIGETDTSGPAKATTTRASTALDSNPILVPVGTTTSGQLWAFDSGTTVVPPAARIPADAGGSWRVIVLLVQGLVIGLALLMSLPTVRSADRVAELNARRPKRRRSRDEDAAVTPDDEPDADEDASVPAESVPDYDGEPEEEAAVESAGDIPEPETESIPIAEAPAEAEPEPDTPPEAKAERDIQPESEAEPEPQPQQEPEPEEFARESATTPAPFEHTHPRHERVTTPTTLEEGLDETIIRSPRGPEGGARG
jgi:hypothetical protein